MIFYFSGSGNSYAVAKQIADTIDDKQIFSLTQFNDFDSCKNSARIGLVFPCYLGTVPDIVIEFKEKLFGYVNTKETYIFCVITYANSPAGSYFCFENDINAWFGIKMPENDIYNSHAPSQGKIESILSKSTISIKNNADDILHKRHIIKRPSKSIYFVAKLANKILKPLYEDFDKKLYTDDTCTKCKQCIKYCPVQNITFDRKPIFNNNCVHCFGCVNRCPKGAIQVTKKTINKRRYVHPNYKNIHYS